MKKIISFLILIAFNQSIYSQNTFNLKEKSNTVYGRFGIEPTYVLGIGYLHSFKLDKINRNLTLFGEVSSPTKIFGYKNYETKLGGILNVIEHKGFGLTYNLNFSMGHVETKNFDSQKFAFANKLLLGYFNRKWYLAFSGEHEKIFANKIKHSQYYRDFIFPEAKDGWYKGAGGNIQLGIETGTTIKECLDLRFEFKIPKSEKFDSYNGSPVNVNLTVGYRF